MAAHAETTPSFNIVHQDALSTLNADGVGQFDVTLGFVSPGSTLTTQINLFPRVITRSELTPLISGASVPHDVLSTTGNFNLTCSAHNRAHFSVSISTTAATSTSASRKVLSPCESHAAHLELPCATNSCDGVYPLSFSVTTNDVTSTTWSLLSVQNGAVAHPLHLSLVEDLAPSTLNHLTTSTQTLDAIARLTKVPLSLTADYRTLAIVQRATAPQDVAYRMALNNALASPLHRSLVAPPSTIDFAGLSANGFTSQVTQQISLSSQLLREVTGRYTDTPVVLSGTPSSASLKALANAHVGELVLNDKALSPQPSATLQWGEPFHPSGLSSITALANDAPLDALANNAKISSGLRSVLTLNTLAFLHFEAPNAPITKTVVMELNPAKATSSYLNDLLVGLTSNPFVRIESLTPSFNSSLIGANGSPTTRSLVTSSNEAWSALNVTTLNDTIGQISSFNHAIASNTISNELDVAAAEAETTGSASTRQRAISYAQSLFTNQLSNFSVDPSAITLAGPGTSLPITLLSKANYSVTAVVHLITDRLNFPKGNTSIVTIDSSTKSLRIPTSNHRGTDLTLQVVVTTPNDQVVLARAAIQVRITGNSIVGYVLSLGSLVVLAYWWLRTYRRKSKGRHAR
jgi:hypothetical protein